MKKLLALTVVILALYGGRTSTASAHTLSKHERITLKKVYYHADGYIKAIGKNARRTIYHPNETIRQRWERDLKYLVKVRKRAWAKLHPKPRLDSGLVNAFICIHGYEGAWNANTGNGYYGGLQMDLAFQGRYGGDFMRRWGTADNWPAWAQLQAAIRAYQSGRGFYPWPNTARACGLI